MEIQILIPSLVSLLCFGFLILLNKWRWRNLPPGPWKVPLIGDLHRLIGAVPHRALHALAQKHGAVMLLQLGVVPTVIVSSADAAKEMMKSHDANFASRYPVLFAEIMSYGFSSVTFSPYGDYLRQLRKICTVELLSAKRVQSLGPLRGRVYSDLACWIASREEGSPPLNLTEKLYASTYSFTTMAALGKETKGREPLLPIFLEGVELAAGFDIAELYPSVKLFQIFSRVKRRLTALQQKSDRILESIIQEHRSGALILNKEEEEEDLLDVLLKYEDEGLEMPLTTDNIKAVLMDMLGAGTETSATTMNWAMAEMLKNPGILREAQDEVRRVFDKNAGLVEESLIPQLKYLKSVVKETLRLHPPATLSLRKNSEACEINGYQIPAHTKVIVNIWAINRDPKYWENPDCFQPERFLDSSVDFRGNHFEYIPFGAGRRICPGINFGLANVELPLAMLLYHFDWKFESQDIDLSEVFGVTTKTKNDLLLVPLIKRQILAY